MSFFVGGGTDYNTECLSLQGGFMLALGSIAVMMCMELLEFLLQKDLMGSTVPLYNHLFTV